MLAMPCFCCSLVSFCLDILFEQDYSGYYGRCDNSCMTLCTLEICVFGLTKARQGVQYVVVAWNALSHGSPIQPWRPKGPYKDYWIYFLKHTGGFPCTIFRTILSSFLPASSACSGGGEGGEGGGIVTFIVEQAVKD